MNATEWFDQFPPNPAMDGHEQWCARHWGPAANLGANGIGALLEIQQIFLNEIAKGTTPAELNREMQELGPICCYLGDERMYEIWGRWGPA